MEDIVKQLDLLAASCGYVYDLRMTKMSDWSSQYFSNKGHIIVEDYTNLNGIYDSIEQLREKAIQFDLDISNDGEIYTDTRGWTGGTTVGHYFYTAK